MPFAKGAKAAPTYFGFLTGALEHIMRPVAHLVIVASMIVSAPSAKAVCIDPTTFISGYRILFVDELESAAAVVVGHVTGEVELREDPSDPEYPTAYVYTVEVSRQLKGNLPQSIQLKSSNDSGRYPMAVGEEHVLFLQSEPDYFVASNCGSSSQLPEGNDIVVQIEMALSESANAP